MNKKRGQIWVETLIYTLIAFVMIGLVLYFASPRIEEAQDKALIEQSINIMKEIDNTILNIGAPGNKRLIELSIRKGALNIDGINDVLVFEIESKHTYSQPGEEIYMGNVVVYTEDKGGYNLITLTSNYSEGYNITYEGKDELKSITKSSTPYKLFILNKGGTKTVINIEIG